MQTTHMRKSRTTMTPDQSRALMSSFARDAFPSTSAREKLSKALGISPRSVQIWFQNQRQKARSSARALHRQEQHKRCCCSNCSRKLYVLAAAAARTIYERDRSAVPDTSQDMACE